MFDAQPIIDGRVIAVASRREVMNPATGELVGSMPWGSLELVDAAVAAARAAFPVWSRRDWAERRAAVLAVADTLERHAEELAVLLCRENGKPLSGPNARFEVGGCIAWTRATASLELPPEAILDDDAHHVVLHRRPIGVFGAITPWNWPLLIAIWQTIPPLLAGNTVVAKPSPNTPLASLRMYDLMNEALPPGVLNAIAGPDELGAAMSAHPDIDKIMFTGSVETGRRVMASAAGSLKRMTLELGGNDAGIVLPDADLAALAEPMFWGAFLNSGQTCAALKRLYVHDAVYEATCRALVRMAESMPMGNGMDERNVLGPLQNAAQRDKVARLVADARTRGARVLCGGQASEGPGYFYPITIVADAEDGMPVVDEEQFGPVLPVLRYTSIDDAVARANSGPLGLGGSVWSSDVAQASAVAARLQCGTVWINRHGEIHPMVPFGGVKSSGFGCEFGVEGLRQCTQAQVISAPRS